MDMEGFDYNTAFSRNLGFLTRAEQEELRHKRVAIPGMGGVGGFHLTTLARLGVGAFNIADMDVFETANFNRQVGADMSTVGLPKVEVMARNAKLINPDLDIRMFPDGVTNENLDEFLDGVDLAIDGFDVFVLNMRARFFAACHEKRIPVITAGPIGMGTAYLSFMPGKMSFAEYFGIRDEMPEEEKIIRFTAGLLHKGLHRPSLIEPGHLDIFARKAPSIPMGCALAAGVAGTETLKILLGRGPVRAAPWYHHFDAYTGRWRQGYIPGGSRNPLQRFKYGIAKQRIDMIKQKANLKQIQAPIETNDRILSILDTARWAPSGDNSQPWRFKRTGPDSIRVHMHFDENAVYEYRNGFPVYQSAGTLLESMRLACADHGRALHWHMAEQGEGGFVLDVTMPEDPSMKPDPLSAFIRERSVNRYPYSRKEIPSGTLVSLERSLGEDFTITWHKTLKQRWEIARLNMMATDIRLRIPETYAVHRKMLDWDNPLSPTGIPPGATGLSPQTQKIMRWTMADWKRVDFMNRYMKGTMIPRIELDLMPGLMCAAHFTISFKNRPADEKEAAVRSGMAFQRFWLTATSHGLSLQPGFGPLVFGYHGRHNVNFTGDAKSLEKARKLARACDALWGTPPDQVVFQGRLGYPKKGMRVTRSVRQPLDALMAS
jgi:molybdopterin/thiamine biosynthesis adenylyltransferase